jgi:hypothetical protein
MSEEFRLCFLLLTVCETARVSLHEGFVTLTGHGHTQFFYCHILLVL